jgi:hypothetical protein
MVIDPGVGTEPIYTFTLEVEENNTWLVATRPGGGKFIRIDAAPMIEEVKKGSSHYGPVNFYYPVVKRLLNGEGSVSIYRQVSPSES